MMNFKPAFSFSSFTFIKRLFGASSLSAMRLVSYAYLRFLIFLMAKKMGNNGETSFWGAPKSLLMVTAAVKLKDACSLEEKL